MLPTCQRCHVPFMPAKSGSILKMTFCSILCEQGELGFSIEGLIRAELKPRPQSLDELMPADWLEPVLSKLPNRTAETPSAAQNKGAMGWKPSWRMYGPTG